MGSYCIRCKKSDTTVREMSGMKNGKPVYYCKETCDHCGTTLREWTKDRDLPVKDKP